MHSMLHKQNPLIIVLSVSPCVSLCIWSGC